MAKSNASSNRCGLSRRKLGRRARKRRKKCHGIVEAAAQVTGDRDLPLKADVNHIKSGPSSVSITTGGDTAKECLVPTDRSYELQSIQALSKLTDLDRKMLANQLGYVPGNAMEIVTRVKDVLSKESRRFRKIMDKAASNVTDEPVVIKLYPLALRDESDSTKSRRKRKPNSNIDTYDKYDNIMTASMSTAALLEPFPTIFWVTHPHIKAIISKMESDGMVLEYERILGTELSPLDVGAKKTSVPDPEKMERKHCSATNSTVVALDYMKEAHLMYGQERYELLLPRDLEYICRRKWESAFSTSRGVAGIRNPATVKCLHAHVAHFWSGCDKNVVGKWVAECVIQALSESVAPTP